MNNLADVMRRTDWTELEQQKLALISAADDRPILEGLLNFLDAVQDAAKADGFPVVFLSDEHRENEH